MAMTAGTAYLINEQFTKSGGYYVRLYLYVKTLSQSVADNQTTLGLGMYVDSQYAIGPWTDFDGSYVGTAASGAGCHSFTGTISNGSGVRWLCENKTVTVTHGADGTATARLCWKWGVSAYSSFIAGYQNPSGHIDVALPAIPRASSIAGMDSYCVPSTAFRVTVSRHSTTFWHKLRLTCGNKSLTSEAFASGISITVPENWNTIFTDAASASASAVLYTYADADCTRRVGGTDTASFTLKATPGTITSLSLSVVPGGELSLTSHAASAAFYQRVRVTLSGYTVTSPPFRDSVSLTIPLSWSAALTGGSATASVYLYTYIDAECKTVVSGVASDTVTVNAGSGAISCASLVTLSDSEDGVCSFSVTRSSSSVYHKARLTCGTHTTAWTAPFAANGTVTLPKSCLSELPNSAEMNATLTVFAYSSAACTTQIGAAMTKTVRVRAADSVVPTLSVSCAPVNTVAAVNAWGVYLKGYSKAAVTVTAAAGTGAALTKCEFNALGYRKTENTASPSYAFTTPVLGESGTHSVSVTLTDTRGRTATQSLSVSIENYAYPRITSAEAVRCLSDGTDDEDGTYLKLTASESLYSVGGRNSATLTCSWRAGSGSFGAARALVPGQALIVSAALSSTQSYTVRFTVRDALSNSDYRDVLLPTAAVCFNAREGGMGAAFGKYAESDGYLELGWGLRLGNSAQISASSGLTPVTLWQSSAGAVTGDTISVPNIGKFTLFVVQFMDSAGSMPLAGGVFGIKIGSVIRGQGGFAGNGGMTLLAASMILNGTTVSLELTKAFLTSNSGYADRKICAIYGLI